MKIYSLSALAFCLACINKENSVFSLEKGNSFHGFNWKLLNRVNSNSNSTFPESDGNKTKPIIPTNNTAEGVSPCFLKNIDRIIQTELRNPWLYFSLCLAGILIGIFAESLNTDEKE